MVKVRLIPTLLVKDTTLVKGIGFDSWRCVGNPVQAVRVYNLRQVDELIILDIMATPDSRPPDFELIDDLADDCFMPLTVGGGVGSVSDVRGLLQAGADKVAINSAAIANPALIHDAARRFGSQCIVASIDVREGSDGTYRVYSNCGQTPTGLHAVDWAKELEALGAGEILLTSVERDGTMKGYDTVLTKRISESVSIPVIASGGAGNFDHMREVLQEGKASAVAAGSMFHFTEQTPAETKQYLFKSGFSVRMWVP